MFENGQNISRSGQFVFIHNHLQDILEPWNHICLWSKLPTLKLIYWHMDKKPLWASMTVICLNLKGNTLHTKLHHHWLTDHLQIHHHKFPRLEVALNSLTWSLAGKIFLYMLTALLAGQELYLLFKLVFLGFIAFHSYQVFLTLPASRQGASPARWSLLFRRLHSLPPMNPPTITLDLIK